MKILLVGFTFALFLQVGAVGYADPAGDSSQIRQGTEKQDGLMNRIDFGNSYIMGQSITSGAVYLLNRKGSDIASMLKDRSDYRQEIKSDSFVIQTSLEKIK